MRAIRVHQHGGPEVLTWDEVDDLHPGPGEAVIRVEAAGLNFIDVYFRTGLYQPASLPFTPGQEGAGTVLAVGEALGDRDPASEVGVAVGDRVAWVGAFGAYAEQAAVPVARLVRLPASVALRYGAAALLQGMTAHYLASTTYPLQPGETCLVHAAAGGVGQLLCQIAKLRGARVLATVSTAEKAEIAREAGADEIIFYTEQDFEAEVKRLTDGRGVQVVYDSVGRTTFEKSLGSLALRGMLALFGQSSGPVLPFAPSLLAAKGSLFLTRPSLFHYIVTREELLSRAEEVLEWVADGRLRLAADTDFPLSEAAEAHRALEGRRTTGKVLLIP
jgi:NADPH2:quinone reductase